MSITHQTSLHLGKGRSSPTIDPSCLGTSRWVDVDGTLSIFFDHPDELVEFADALRYAARSFAP